MTPLPEIKAGFWAKCRTCSHCWIIAYLPMGITDFARLAGKASCPMCGDRKPGIAKQDNGVLQEETA